ncbi:MAG TPA: hypothetical protein VNQ80_16465 [Parapedobacter sp.]|uniref:hypothetical protein n=1 Tax=Parapedobacter sp. TaxID=1958893 RepID=UPI002B5E9B58|nr:hypothetical protein [Parapedobacter sp.]HWK58941.1 hypothetical protein [Parapedobacter sp.]
MSGLIRILICVIATTQLSFAQTFVWQECDVWLPKKAIEDIVKNNTISNYSKFSTPIQSLVVYNEELYVRTLFGKVVKPKIEQIGNKKELIQPLVLNLKYFNEGDFEGTRFFLSDKGQDSVLLEIVNEEKIDSIYMIKNLGQYAFTEPYLTYNSILLQGDYQTSIDGVETKVSLCLDGQIKGHPEWVSYVVKRVNVPSVGNSEDLYCLLEFMSKEASQPSHLAFLYDDNLTVWTGYQYEVSKDKYKIVPSDKPVVRLERRILSNNN